jgi:hypothetical protein
MLGGSPGEGRGGICDDRNSTALYRLSNIAVAIRAAAMHRNEEPTLRHPARIILHSTHGGVGTRAAKNLHSG